MNSLENTIRPWLEATLATPDVNACGWSLAPGGGTNPHGAELVHTSRARVLAWPDWHDSRKAKLAYVPPAIDKHFLPVAKLPLRDEQPKEIRVSRARNPRHWFADFVRRLGIPSVVCEIKYRDALEAAADTVRAQKERATRVARALRDDETRDPVEDFFALGEVARGVRGEIAGIRVRARAKRWHKMDRSILQLENLPDALVPALVEWLRERAAVSNVDNKPC